MCLSRYIVVTIVFFLLGGLNLVLAQPADYPTPAGNPNQLFYMQRTLNKNTIVYELNYKNGQFNKEDPVHVYWIRYQEKGQKAELSFVQRKFAFGIKSKKTAENQYELSLISQKHFKMYLQKGADGKFHVYTLINKKMLILTKMYIHMIGGALWSPNVEYAEITGIEPVSGQEVKEKIKM